MREKKNSTLGNFFLSFQMSSADQTKIEILRRKINERKACEKRAFETCVKLIEANQVDDETLIQSVKSMIDEKISNEFFSF